MTKVKIEIIGHLASSKGEAQSTFESNMGSSRLSVPIRRVRHPALVDISKRDPESREAGAGLF